jgi:ABC-2 type transport system permease protein
VRSVLSTAGVGGLIVLVMGAVHSAGGYRHGTIAATLLTTPNRLRAMCGQALACGLAGVAVGVLMCVITVAIALPWLAAKDAPSLSGGETLGLLGGNVLYAALAAAFGSGLGATLRNQVLAVVLLLVLIFVIDPTLAAVVDDYAPYSLSGLSSSLSGSSPDPTDELLPVWEATLIWAGYTVVLVTAAAAHLAPGHLVVGLRSRRHSGGRIIGLGGRVAQPMLIGIEPRGRRRLGARLRRVRRRDRYSIRRVARNRRHSGNRRRRPLRAVPALVELGAPVGIG